MVSTPSSSARTVKTRDSERYQVPVRSWASRRKAWSVGRNAVRAVSPSASTATGLAGSAVSTAVTALSRMSKSRGSRSNPAPSFASTVARLRSPGWCAGFPWAVAGRARATEVPRATARTPPARASRRVLMCVPSLVVVEQEGTYGCWCVRDGRLDASSGPQRARAGRRGSGRTGGPAGAQYDARHDAAADDPGDAGPSRLPRRRRRARRPGRLARRPGGGAGPPRPQRRPRPGPRRAQPALRAAARPARPAGRGARAGAPARHGAGGQRLAGPAPAGPPRAPRPARRRAGQGVAGDAAAHPDGRHRRRPRRRPAGGHGADGGPAAHRLPRGPAADRRPRPLRARADRGGRRRRRRALRPRRRHPGGGAVDRPREVRREPAAARPGSPSSGWASAAPRSSTTSATSTCCSSPSRPWARTASPCSATDAAVAVGHPDGGRAEPDLLRAHGGRDDLGGRRGAAPRGQGGPAGPHGWPATRPTTSAGRRPGSSRPCSRPGPCAGDLALGQEFVDMVAPMVWQAAERENFVADAQAMRKRVVAHIPAREQGRELKLGEGGLRDVEFSVQLLQLVHGRVDERLRTPGHPAGAEGAGRQRLRRPRGRQGLRSGLPLPAHARAPDPAVPAAPHPRAARRRRPTCAGSAARSATPTRPSELLSTWRHTAQRVRRLHERLFYSPLLDAVARIPARELRLTTDAGGRPAAGPRLRRPAGRAAPHRRAQPGRVPAGRDPAPAAAGHARLVRRRAQPRRRSAGLPPGVRGAGHHALVPAGAARRGGDGRAAGPHPRLQPVRGLAADPGPADRADAGRRAASCARARWPTSAGRCAPPPAGRADAEAGGRGRSGRSAGASCSGSRPATCWASCDVLAVGDGADRPGLGHHRRRAGGGPGRRSDAAAVPPIAVIAMGRWGGREMSYASDADAMFVMADEPRQRRRRRPTRAAGAVISEMRRLLARPGADPALTRRRRPAARGQGRRADPLAVGLPQLLRPLVLDLGAAGAGPGRRAGR